MQLRRMRVKVIHDNDLDLPKRDAQRAREIVGGAIENPLDISIARPFIDQRLSHLVRQMCVYLPIAVETSTLNKQYYKVNGYTYLVSWMLYEAFVLPISQ